ncbi:MAG TPA: hypothetical protein VN781_02955 [Acidimicrobiales bacterium]|nr:hypothetical protein [Acidimicrobiales bacterium]
MFVSYVLRVRPESVSNERFVGEVEAVGTGQRYAVRSFDQVLAFVLETMRDEVDLTRDALSVQEDL